MTKTLNLDAIHPEKSELILGGKTFDITVIPLKVFLTIQKKVREKEPISLDWFRVPLLELLQTIDPSITAEWVESVTGDCSILRALDHKVFGPVINDPLPGWISDDPTSPYYPKTETTEKTS